MVNCTRAPRSRSASMGSQRPHKPIAIAPSCDPMAIPDGAVAFKTEPLDSLFDDSMGMGMGMGHEGDFFDGLLATFDHDPLDSSSASDPESPAHYGSLAPMSQSLPATFSTWDARSLMLPESLVPGSLPAAGGWDLKTDAKPFPTGAPPRRQRRRDSHNAVERRRRDNINDRIIELGGLVPESFGEKNLYNSKGETLRKAAQYIRHLMAANAQLHEAVVQEERRQKDGR